MSLFREPSFENSISTILLRPSCSAPDNGPLPRSRSLLSHLLVALTAWHSAWNDATARYRTALDALVAAVCEHASTNHHSDGSDNSGSSSSDGIAALQWLVDQTAGLASAVQARGDRAGSVLFSAVQGSGVAFTDMFDLFVHHMSRLG